MDAKHLHEGYPSGYMMRRRIARVLTSLLLPSALLFSAGCSNHDHPSSDETLASSPVLAKVGDLEIRDDEVQRELALLPPALRESIDEHQLRKKILRQLIRRRVLTQQATKNGLDLEPAVRWKIQRLKENILIEELRARFLRSLPEPKKDEIAKYFQAHKNRYEQPERLRLRHWVSKNRQAAMELWEKLRTRSSAHQNLTTPVSERWINVPEIPAQWRKVLSRLDKSSDVSKPVKLDEKWHIFQIVEKHSALTPKPEDIRDQIIADMHHDQWETWVASLMEHKPIRVLQAEYADILND